MTVIIHIMPNWHKKNKEPLYEIMIINAWPSCAPLKPIIQIDLVASWLHHSCSLSRWCIVMITCHSEVTCTLSHVPSLRLFFCDARNGKCFFFFFLQRYFSNLHLRGEGWRWTWHGFRRCSAWLATAHSERKSWCPLLLATKELYGFCALLKGNTLN